MSMVGRHNLLPCRPFVDQLDLHLKKPKENERNRGKFLSLCVLTLINTLKRK